jgi:hypothetical protein
MSTAIDKYDQDTHNEHAGELEGGKGVGHVTDTLAANYVDPTITISEEENKRLRRKIFKQ